MNHRILSVLGVLTVAAGVWVQAAQGTTIKVNETTIFSTNYEGDAATALTFGDAANTNADDFDPSTTQTGAWWTPLVSNVTGTIYEGLTSTASFSYVVASKQVQVTNSTATGGTGLNFDPGPAFGQGINYLRGYRTNSNTSGWNGKWEALPAPFTTTGSDTITFESAVYITPFTANGTTTAEFLTVYNDFTAFTPRIRLNVDNLGNLRNGTGTGAPDTGLDLPLGQWSIVSASYTEGAATWSLSVNGGPAVTGLAVLAAGSVNGLSFGGGQQNILRVDDTGSPLLYFDAVPEPGAMLLAAIGIIGLAAYRLRKRK